MRLKTSVFRPETALCAVLLILVAAGPAVAGGRVFVCDHLLGRDRGEVTPRLEGGDRRIGASHD